MDRDVEALLWASRPEPDAAWIERTENRVLPRRPERRPSRSWRLPAWRPVRAGFALAAAVALTVFGLELGGADLLGDGASPSRATPGATTPCRERPAGPGREAGRIVRDRDGTLRVTPARPKPAKRCH